MSEGLLDEAIRIAKEKGFIDKMEYLIQIKEGEKDYGEREQQRPKRPAFRLSNGGRTNRTIRNFKKRS